MLSRTLSKSPFLPVFGKPLVLYGTKADGSSQTLQRGFMNRVPPCPYHTAFSSVCRVFPPQHSHCRRSYQYFNFKTSAAVNIKRLSPEITTTPIYTGSTHFTYSSSFLAHALSVPEVFAKSSSVALLSVLALLWAWEHPHGAAPYLATRYLRSSPPSLLSLLASCYKPCIHWKSQSLPPPHPQVV